VIIATDVTDEAAWRSLQLAEPWFFPSLKEGFGWPLIEAQPAVVRWSPSDRPPMNRIAGPRALLADPDDAAALPNRSRCYCLKRQTDG